MTEQDFDLRLRDAGARLRAGAPTPEETDHALTRVSERSAPRSPWRWAGPALVVGAAAAATIAVLVVTQDEDTLRQVPAESTVLPTAAPTTAAPVVVPGTGSVAAALPPVSTAPAGGPAGSAAPITTTTAPATTTVPAAGWVVTVVEENYDGDGGACVEVSRGGAAAGVAGCIGGDRAASRVPVFGAVEGTWLAIAVEGDVWVAHDVAEFGNEFTAACLGLVPAPERLVDLAGCTGEAAISGFLPTDSSGATEWHASRWTALGGESVTSLADVAAPPGVRAFEIIGTIRGSGEPRCVAVVVEGTIGWRESCAPLGDDAPFLAGTGSQPMHVEVDTERTVTRITALDPDVVPLVHGCRATLGQLLASVAAGATSGLRCDGGVAITGVSGTTVHDAAFEPGVTLQRDAGDGTWPIGDAGPTLTCARYAETCAAFGATEALEEALLPIPRLEVLTGPVPGELGADLLDPTDVTERFTALETFATVDDLADGVSTAWRADGDAETRFVRGPGDASPLLLTATGIPDDSVGGALLAVWYSPEGGRIGIDAVTEILACSRGTTTLDGTTVCV